MRAILGWVLLGLLVGTFPLPAQPSSGVRTADVKTMQGVLKGNRGRVVLVYFWATWCARCAGDMADLASLQARFGARGFQVVGISTDEPATLHTRVLPFLERCHANFPNYLEGPDHDALVCLFSSSWVGQPPIAFIYDRQGTLAHELRGRQSLSRYAAIVGALL